MDVRLDDADAGKADMDVIQVSAVRKAKTFFFIKNPSCVIKFLFGFPKYRIPHFYYNVKLFF